MLEMKNVSGGYGKRMVVSEINAVFPKGEITSVIGANGCGKSTLLMLAAGLIPCETGTVLADGEDISEISRNGLARKLSYLPQMKNPGSISVRSLVSHGRFPYLGYPRRYTEFDRKKIDEAMALAGVSELADRNFGELSGGQQQRVRIAMTLAQDTGIILLDEPLTYLDIRHKLETAELIKTLREMGKTIVAVMHDLDIAFAFSDKIAVMDAGRLTAFGAPDEIAESGAVEKALGVRALYSGEFGRYFFVK